MESWEITQPTQLIECMVNEPIGNGGMVQRIVLTEAGQKALTTKATSLGTGFYISRAERQATAEKVVQENKKQGWWNRLKSAILTRFSKGDSSNG